MPEPEVRMHSVEARKLTEGDWASFGWLPVPDTDPTDGVHRLEYEWGDPHLNIIGHTKSEIPVIDGGLRCEMLYRHTTHTQVLMALDHSCVIAVARPGSVLEAGEGVGSIEAFVIEPLQPLVLHRGTWHWGPFPIRADEVRLLNVQGLRFAEDNEMLDLAGRGLAVDVLVG